MRVYRAVMDGINRSTVAPSAADESLAEAVAETEAEQKALALTNDIVNSYDVR